LDICKTLKENLSYKTLIEYPVLHVVLADHWKEFPPKGTGKKQTPFLNIYFFHAINSCTNANLLMLY